LKNRWKTVHQITFTLRAAQCARTSVIRRRNISKL